MANYCEVPPSFLTFTSGYDSMNNNYRAVQPLNERDVNLTDEVITTTIEPETFTIVTTDEVITTTMEPQYEHDLLNFLTHKLQLVAAHSLAVFVFFFSQHKLLPILLHKLLHWWK